MKKIVTAGDRVYLKFFNMDFFRERAKAAGAELHMVLGLDDGEFKNAIRDADGLILIDRPLTKEHIAIMERCKIVLALEVGYDFIDVEAATRRKIPVSNVPAYCTHQVAFHALTLILSVGRRLKQLIAETSKGGWDYKTGAPVFELQGMKLGIVGLGRIGRSLAAKAGALGLRVAAYDPYLADDLFKLLNVERFYDLEDLLGASDFVSLHVPLNGETLHMIGERELRRMKSAGILINTCRGKVIDEKSLYKALQNRIIAGAGLDVLEKEPPDGNNPLLGLNNVIVTPHAAWYSENSMERLREQGMDEVIRALEGKRPKNLVNPEVLY